MAKDALVGMAHVGSPRLFYERAAAAGDAQAALRWGATYDRHSCVARARSDEAMAAYWYRRARELAPSKQEVR
jgi:TPR repeat protein